ncbi:lipopolysaccharide biosynthesis protein [Winogradskyella immobilis]|uniref:Polysaccharide biosynthesis C-terminal domain-containing protein n=1 Tax=Winogradskyella immobilis TaxID=2816852 RepID=A0ABS8EMZ8_9FLAO|nr:polysaccharide biosynthesis C-terminal domain-containing protein [Winogradskyella immobilis]MCC1484598.1 polysaccharide biosynthesis C-terminal domain-containing protein [Winogradskyella immobilis]MCG0016690.1 polysaccharide biosynthesis C-terminal domain-containing protein [Winogradskyella immobilis]
MGIVINQSFKNTISTYLGFGIGAINTLFLYTSFLTDTHYGLVAFILSTANILMPFMAFGVHNAIIKFYSTFKTKNSLNSFLTLMLFLPFVLVIPAGFIGYIGYENIGNLLSAENPIIKNYLWQMYSIAITMAYFEIFFAWSKTQLKTVFGNLMREVFHRIGIMILLFCVYFNWVTVDQFIIGIVSVYLLRMLIMMCYAFTVRIPVLKFSKPNGLSSILKYCMLIIIAGSVAMFILDIDKFMIGQYLEIETVAYYSVAIFIATVIAVPQRAMHQIMMPLTAKFLNNKDDESLKDLYTRSSLNLLIISGFIFLLIVLNINTLYLLLPEKFTGGLFVVIIISLAKLYDNCLGNNNAILFNSNYYRMVLFFGVLLAIMAVVLNVIFIPLYGIEGSALATFLAIFIYNSIKLIFVKQKFNMQPFNIKTIKVLLLLTLLSFGLYFIEFPFPTIISIITKSIVITLLYFMLVYKLNLSEDISIQIKKYLKLS